jgi:membrane-associated protein
MDQIKYVIDLFLHLDKYLALIIDSTGYLSYIILFAVIFAETGLVITPFLPGDSLIFAAGALAAKDLLNILLLYALLLAAAFLGDTANYWIGHYIGPKAFNSNSRFLKKAYMDKAQGFYEKHGGKAIILARFVPIVRTFAPFVAGIGKMNYGKFLIYNMVGGFLWVSGFLFAGYFMGNIPLIKDNFHYTVVLIVLVSLIPIAYEFIKSKREAKASPVE